MFHRNAANNLLRPEPLIERPAFLLENVAVSCGEVTLQSIQGNSGILPKEKLPTVFRWRIGLSVSLILHGVFLGAILAGFLLGSQTTRFESQETIPVELVMGFNDEETGRVVTKPDVQVKDQEATKAPETLPQLPKTIDTDEPPPPDSVAPLKTPEPTVIAAVTPKPLEGAKVEGVKVDKNELKKRVEKEARAVGKEDRQGVHRKVDSVEDLASPDALPDNPFGPSVFDEISKQEGSKGDLAGNLSAGAGGYKVRFLEHLMKFWTIPSIMSFPAGLVCRIDVEVGRDGRVIGKQLLESSGSDEFDREAFRAVEQAMPFPRFQDHDRRFVEIFFRSRGSLGGASR